MVEESAVLIPRDDEHTARPECGVANRLVSRFDESLAESHVGQGMLRRAASVVVQHVVAGLNKNVAVWEGGLSQIVSKWS